MANRIANPIYDSVFKFLMEDERVARTLLSALLQKKVVKVEMRPHEYTNTQQDRISIFRIDFGAYIREDNGSEHLIIVELQKTWRPTETLRFRRYLGVQYGNERNISDIDGEPLPIVSIYLLGHKVDDLKESVVYVRRQYLDYESREITEGVPSAFVERLTHDSIIVQIPYLSGAARNHIEKLLTFFDQSYVSEESKQVLTIDGRNEQADDDLQYIFTRLAYAAANPEVRHMMDVEDEILGELEDLDTKIAQANKKIAEKDAQISTQQEQISTQQEQITSAIKLLAASGIPIETIASNFNLAPENVRSILDKI